MYWLRRKIHPTWQLTILCAGLVIGVALARVCRDFGAWLWLALGLLLCAVALWRSRRFLIVAALLGGVLIGLWRGGVDQTALSYYRTYIGTVASVEGVVDGDISVVGSDIYAMQLRDIRIAGHELTGSVYVTTSDHGEAVRRGDEVVVKGVLMDGFGNISAMMYRATLVSAVRPSPGDVALDVRDTFAGSVRRAIDEPGASLGVGFLLGQKSALPSDLMQALQVAGLTHIVVASGYNLMILVRLARRVFEKTSRYLATVASGMLIIGFIAMTGMTPSMTRAGLVAALGVAAWYVGRKFHPVTLLLFAAAVTVAMEPSNVWGNVGWMLSFAAFAGVMVVAPVMTAYFFGKEKVPFIAQLFIETLSAQLVTLPIIASVFGTVSVISLVANVLILPLIPFTMLLVFVTGLVGFVSPVLQSIVAWPSQVVLDVIVRIIERCASLPGAQIEWHVGPIVVLASYMMIAGTCIYMKWRAKYSLRLASVVD